ncbi:kidney androgen-regulated protein-like isoform X2 [Peromyscus maniculatus bairdii]|uniref:kidney androgen-regulated protein-like isoform X2 n=1 Tax=Peromyscus maniculatus bairdii TaxID=230844 RepID=UPI00077DEDA5
MMLYKILVISVLCALAVAFPSLDIETTYDPLDPFSEEPLNSTVDYEELQDSMSGPLKTAGNLPPPVEKVIRALKNDTDNDLTTDFNPTLDLTPTTEAYYESTQIFVSFPDAETDSPSFLEESSEASDPIPASTGNLKT